MNKYNLSFTDVINNMDNYKIGTIIESENGNQYKIIHTDCKCKRPSRINNTGLRFMTYNNTKVMFRIVENEKWIPKHNEEYWYYDKDMEEIKFEPWFNSDGDNKRLKNKVIFKTEAEAERYKWYQAGKEAYSYEFSKEEWEDEDISKSYIYYDYEDKKIYADSTSYVCRYPNMLYFKTSDQAQEFIDKYKSEILEFEFGIKE